MFYLDSHKTFVEIDRGGLDMTIAVDWDVKNKDQWCKYCCRANQEWKWRNSLFNIA